MAVRESLDSPLKGEDPAREETEPTHPTQTEEEPQEDESLDCKERNEKYTSFLTDEHD